MENSNSKFQLDEKVQIIKENKDATIAAITAVLDTIYNFTNPITNKKGNIKTALFKDKKAEDFALGLNKDKNIYENLRSRLQKDDFDLSLTDIAYINNTYVFCIKRSQTQVEALMKAYKLMVDISTKLTALDSIESQN